MNIDDRMRALRLVEASGDFEIGDWRNPNGGFNGDGWNDPFHAGVATQMRFDTRPNNWNNDWAHTGWEIRDVREAPPESQLLRVHVEHGLAGWPRLLRAASDTLPPLDPRGAVVGTIPPLGPRGPVVGTMAGLGPVLVAADSDAVWGFDLAGAHALHRGAIRTTSLAYHPRLAPGDPSGTFAAVDRDRVWLWDAVLQSDSLAPRAGYPVAVVEGCTGRPLPLGPATPPATGLRASGPAVVPGGAAARAGWGVRSMSVGASGSSRWSGQWGRMASKASRSWRTIASCSAHSHSPARRSQSSMGSMHRTRCS